MIPRTLQIKNFLSYGPELQTISFDSYHLICLSGKNGHGKSALLDAMTWALWGMARKTSAASRADQNLLHLGQSMMAVIFDFEVHNTHYRIKRCYEIVYGKPQTTLEFGIVNDQELVPLTDKTIRTTQERIDAAIGLDFDTFINSAFLRQGGANEFSKRAPKDRKEIITAILGLQTYDILRKAAVEKVKTATTQRITLLALQEKITKELEQVHAVSAQTQQLETQLASCITLHTELTSSLAGYAHQKQHLITQEKKRDVCLATTTQCTETMNRLKTELHTTRTAWRSTHRAQILCADPSALEQRKRDLLRSIEHHSALQQKIFALKEEVLVTRESLQQCTHELSTQEHTQQRDTLLLLERLKAELALTTTALDRMERDVKTYQLEITQHDALIEKTSMQCAESPAIQQQLTQQRALFEKRKEAYQRLATLGNMLRTELATIQQKMHLSQDKEDPSCPLCEQNLSATRRRFLITKLTAQAHNVNHRCERLKRILPLLKQALITEHETIQALQQKVDSYVALQHTLETTHNKRNELIQKRDDYQLQIHDIHSKQISLRDAIDLQTKTLHAASDNAVINALKAKQQTITTHLQTLTQQATKISYDQLAHEKAVLELKQLDQQLHNQDAIKQQMAWQNERKNNIAHLCTQLKQQKITHALLETELTTYANLEQQRILLESKEREVTQQIHAHSLQKETLLQEKGRLESEDKKLRTLADEHKQQELVILSLDEHIQDYQAIAQAASKDGIQALLIEDAIPEIEQEANALLSKLTNNQAHISIESLRDLKNGNSKETLDINISDAAGIRPYELFSGGEAFRIDFALRIAISKLLARRAGTALQTLIIDEGFGSQDEEGLSLMMDAMYKIQDDFAKVIIVSHLPSMKDQFPVHFIVEKNAQGSFVSVIEQG